MLRKGMYPDVKDKPPTTPGYDMVGIVDATGPGATCFVPGDRVADLTTIGACNLRHLERIRDRAMHGIGAGHMRDMTSVVTGIFLPMWHVLTLHADGQDQHLARQDLVPAVLLGSAAPRRSGRMADRVRHRVRPRASQDPLSWERRPFSEGLSTLRPRPEPGCVGCWNANRPGWSAWRWRTKRPVLFSPSCRRRKLTTRPENSRRSIRAPHQMRGQST